MKKFVKYLCFAIFLFSAGLVFFACGSEPIVLQKPATVGWTDAGQRNPDTGVIETSKFVLVTDKNRYASGYKFFLTDNSDFENYNNYVALPVSQNNFIDVTSKIDRQKQYHFFVQYIGTGKYKNSEYSKIAVMEPESVQIGTPYLQMIGTNLYWFKIQNATGYEIYETVIDGENNKLKNQIKIATTNDSTFSYDFSSRLNDEQSPYYKYQYQIKALGSGNHLDSQLSVISENVTHTKQITLGKVLNVDIDFNTKVLTFDKVKYATNYEIKVNKTGYSQTINSATNSVNLQNAGIDFSTYETYSFSVKAVESDVLSYTLGEESDALEKDYKTKFDAPTTMNVSQVGDSVNFAWDAVQISSNSAPINAQSYTLVVSYNGQEKIFENIETTSKTLTFVDLFDSGTLAQDVEITVKIKADAINQYIEESEYLIAPDPTNPTATKIIITKIVSGE
ncbi:MAG: hypothetical protein ACI4TI_00730 [Christensenellales bacterium]